MIPFESFFDIIYQGVYAALFYYEKTLGKKHLTSQLQLTTILIRHGYPRWTQYNITTVGRT